MKAKSPNTTVADLVMQTLTELQRSKKSAAAKDIKDHIIEKHGNKGEKYLDLVAQFLRKGVNLGIITKKGDHYRTKMYYVAKRRKGRGRRRRRRRRRRRDD